MERPVDREPESLETRPLRVLVALAGGAMFLDALLFGALAPLLPTYVDDLRLSTSQAGVLSGAIGAGILLGAIPTAALANRIGGKRATVSGLVLLTAASIVFAVADVLEVMVASRFLQGVAGAAIWAGALVWVAGATDPSRRGAAIGTLVGIGVAGTVAGPLAGSLAVATSPELVFGAIPVIAVVLMVLLAALPESPRELQSGGLARLWSQPPARLAAAANLWFLLLPAAAIGLVSVLGPLQLDALGVAAGVIGLVFLCAGGVEAAINAVGGRLSDRVGTVAMLRAGMLAMAAMLAFFALATGAVATALAIVAVAVAMGVFGAPINISLYSVLGEAGVGEAHAFGFYNLGFAGGYLVGATGGAALADLAGDVLPCLLLTVGALLSSQLARRTAISRPEGQTRASEAVPSPTSSDSR